MMKPRKTLPDIARPINWGNTLMCAVIYIGGAAISISALTRLAWAACH